MHGVCGVPPLLPTHPSPFYFPHIFSELMVKGGIRDELSPNLLQDPPTLMCVLKERKGLLSLFLQPRLPIRGSDLCL